MSAWSWVIVGLAAYVGGSVVVAVALSAILRIVRRDEVEWEPEEPWASAPLSRDQGGQLPEPAAGERAPSDRRRALDRPPTLSPLSRRSG